MLRWLRTVLLIELCKSDECVSFECKPESFSLFYPNKQPHAPKACSGSHRLMQSRADCAGQISTRGGARGCDGHPVLRCKCARKNIRCRRTVVMIAGRAGRTFRNGCRKRTMRACKFTQTEIALDVPLRVWLHSCGSLRSSVAAFALHILGRAIIPDHVTNQLSRVKTLVESAFTCRTEVDAAL